MDFTKRLKPLQKDTDWPMWKRKIRDILDYHEGALDVIDKNLLKPLPLDQNATAEEKKEYKINLDLYRKANSYAKSMLISAVSDEIYEKIMDQSTASDTWDALKLLFEGFSKVLDRNPTLYARSGLLPSIKYIIPPTACL